jgi:uncharacterized protein (UPF0333 family)
MKKGQAAMEFLMTYGWAILVVLAAIGALAYFGVLSPDRFMPSKCMISGGFSCVEYKLLAGDATATPVVVQAVRFYIQNNLGADADSVNVTLADNSGITCQSGGADSVDLGALANGVKSPVVVFDETCALTSGSSFKGNIVVTYQKSGETETHTATGTISGRFES